VWTAYWSLRFGLAPRPPLSTAQITLRIAIATGAAAFWFLRRDRLERLTLICATVAASSSALYGFGYTSPAVRANRLLFHFLGYALGAIAIARLWNQGPSTHDSVWRKPNER
jgi:hypothetical protein